MSEYRNIAVLGYIVALALLAAAVVSPGCKKALAERRVEAQAVADMDCNRAALWSKMTGK